MSAAEIANELQRVRQAIDGIIDKDDEEGAVAENKDSDSPAHGVTLDDAAVPANTGAGGVVAIADLLAMDIGSDSASLQTSQSSHLKTHPSTTLSVGPTHGATPSVKEGDDEGKEENEEKSRLIRPLSRSNLADHNALIRTQHSIEEEEDGDRLMPLTSYHGQAPPEMVSPHPVGEAGILARGTLEHVQPGHNNHNIGMALPFLLSVVTLLLFLLS